MARKWYAMFKVHRNLRDTMSGFSRGKIAYHMDPIASFVLKTQLDSQSVAILLWRGYSTYWRNQRCSRPFQWIHGRSNPKRHWKTERISCFEILGKKTQYFDYFRWVCNLQIAPRRRVFCQTLETLNGFWLFTRVDHQFLRLFPAIHLLFQIWGPVTVHFLSFLPLCHQVLIFMPGLSHTKQGLVYTNKRKHRNSNYSPQKMTQLHIGPGL